MPHPISVLTEGHAHDHVLQAYLASKLTEECVEAEDVPESGPSPTVEAGAASHVCRKARVVRGFPIYYAESSCPGV